jgi:hypothetical protein
VSTGKRESQTGDKGKFVGWKRVVAELASRFSSLPKSMILWDLKLLVGIGGKVIMFSALKAKSVP